MLNLLLGQMTSRQGGMARSSAEYFLTGVAACYAAAQSAKDATIKQAYLELARGWQALADEIERLRSQTWQPQIFSGHALPHRSLEDFYELRPAQSGKLASEPAAEHPALGDQHDPIAKGRAGLSPRPDRGSRRAHSF